MDADNLVKRDFTEALKAADAKRAEAKLPTIGKVRWHDLRYTFGSLKIEQGENIKCVQVQMEHSDIKITLDVYGHLLKDANPAAAARTDRLVFGDAAAV